MSEETNESQNETATGEASPLPFRVLWWRALVAIAIGGFCGWAIATFWCHTLGELLFPSVFPAGRIMVAANTSVGLTTMAGAVLGMVMVFARGTVWLRAFASIIGVWLGGTVAFMGALSFVIFSYFLLTKLPPDNTQPPLTAADYKFSLWTFVPMLLSGGSVLFSVFKMHVSNNTSWFQNTKENIRESFIAVLKPQERHRLERFILQSPLSCEECQARLAQIADVETSPFAFWEKLPLPGFKPLTVKVKNNHWRFHARYRSVPFTFHADATPVENGTQIHCVSRWIPFAKYYALFIFSFPIVITIPFATIQSLSAVFVGEANLFEAILNFFILITFGFLSFGFFAWCGMFLTIRPCFWMGRRQELMAVEAMQKVLEAQIIERQSVRYKWGLFEQS
jgi:hypothetical protein